MQPLIKHSMEHAAYAVNRPGFGCYPAGKSDSLWWLPWPAALHLMSSQGNACHVSPTICFLLQQGVVLSCMSCGLAHQIRR